MNHQLIEIGKIKPPLPGFELLKFLQFKTREGRFFFFIFNGLSLEFSYGVIGVPKGASFASFRFVDFQIDAGIVFHSDNPQERSDGLSGVAASAYDFTHIGRINIKAQKYSHFINGSFDLDGVRIVNQ